MIYPLLKSALEMRNALRTAPKSHPFAQVVPAFPTDSTLTAGNTNFKSYPVPNGEAAYLGANRNDGTRRLMAQRKR